MNRGLDPKDQWEFYEDKRGDWRWRRKSVNGNIIGAASEGYKARKDGEADAERQGWSA
jgi:uncharacterized protein YegP (UPF0339 family)